MRKAFRSLDRILRGEATDLPILQQGQFDVPIGGLIVVVILLGVLYGACMGLPSLIVRWNPHPLQVMVHDASGSHEMTYLPTRYEGFQQMLASMAKVPLLFLLTLLVTFPSLYVFNALVGSRLTMTALLKLLIAAISVMLALLAAFGPIVAFFAASTNSYPFMKLLNVVVFSIAGFMGLAFLLQTLHKLTIAQAPPPPPPGEEASSVAASIHYARQTEQTAKVTKIFRIWVVVFGLVGAQMGWVLRPFIGNPDQPFSFFRARDSNFFDAMGRTFSHLFGSG